MVDKQVYSLYRKYEALYSIKVSVYPFYCDVNDECAKSNLYYRHIEFNQKHESIECIYCHSIYHLVAAHPFIVEYIFKKVKIVIV